MALRVEQHRGRDDRRHLFDAELLQRGLRTRLHVGLRVAAVIPCLVGGEVALAIPRLGQHGEMADCIHLRALRSGLPAHGLLAVEGVPRARDSDRRPIFFPQRHAERRLRHGVRAQVGELVGLGPGIGKIGCAALPGRRPERVCHPELVARRPRRARRLRRGCRDQCARGRERTGEPQNDHRSHPRFLWRVAPTRSHQFPPTCERDGLLRASRWMGTGRCPRLLCLRGKDSTSQCDRRPLR